MNLGVNACALALCLAGCGTALSEPPPLRLEPGRPVQLKPGESAATADGTLRVGFEAVTADSRCPKNVQCVRAGDATVRIWLQRGGAAREWRELHTSTGRTREAPDPGLRLLRLEPLPLAERVPDPRAYVATLELASPAPER